jgi:hypothetical protein
MAADKVDGGARADFAAHHDAYRVPEAVVALGNLVRRRSDAEIGVIIARRMSADQLLGHERRALGVAADLRVRDLFTGEVTIMRQAIDPLREAVVRRTALVMEWATKARRPDWISDPHYGWERGRAVYAHGASRQAATKHRVLFVQVRPSGDDPFDVEEARGVYREWVLCLADLRRSLLGAKLSAHQISDTLPTTEPWKFSGSA